MDPDKWKEFQAVVDRAFDDAPDNLRVNCVYIVMRKKSTKEVLYYGDREHSSDKWWDHTQITHAYGFTSPEDVMMYLIKMIEYINGMDDCPSGRYTFDGYDISDIELDLQPHYTLLHRKFPMYITKEMTCLVP